ncbi:MAG TPA: AAA family ATPase, partial [Anaerolineales bacterium]|nr:AAA family ATPase [Anaerolineales bacterium]
MNRTLNVWIKTLFTASGFALAGPSGALIGKVAGGLLATVLPGASGFVGDIVSRLVSRTVERSGSILWDSLTSEDRYRINHDLQTAFRDAFKEALSDLGGRSCFPEAWISRRDVPARMIYPSTPEANRLWRSRDPLAQQVCDCLNAMRAAVDAQLLLPLDPPHQTPAADVRIYLDAETPEALAGLFFDQVVAPFLASYGTLTAELPTLESHLRLYLLDRTLVHLGELLKARTPAWRAFNRMLLEEVRAGVQEVGSSQVEMLSRLDLLLDRSNLEPLDALSAGLADLLSASGRVEKQLGEGLDTLLQRVAEQHGDVLAHFETLIVLGGRIETKVDRVLRILENGRFIIEGTPSVPVDTPPEPGEPPFKGLQFFDQGDADLFFGRELLTARLIGRLTGALSQAHEDGDAAGLQFLAIIGASGSGKSSVARAGLIPAIKRGETLADGSLPPPGSQEWRVHLITPSAHPLEALAASLTRGKDPVATANLLSSLAADPHSLRLHARQLLDPGNGQPHNDSPPGSQDLLLVVDQFEELFTLCRSEEESKAFIDNLLAACSEQGPVILVITLRADFYQHCAKYENLRAALERRQAYIGPMSREELRCAIEEPALRGEWKFEPGLVDLFLREVGEEPGALPLLSHALLETWKHRRGRAMTLESYAESGGVSGAIAKTAETIFYQQGHTNLVNWVSFGPDGQQVLTASGDQTARLWRLDGMQIGSFQGHTNWVTMAAFSPDGQRIVTTSFDNTLRIWQPDGTLVAELKGHAGWPVMFSFSPDGGRLV